MNQLAFSLKLCKAPEAAVPPTYAKIAITANKVPKIAIEVLHTAVIPLGLASLAALSALAIKPDMIVNVNVTTYCPNVAKIIQAPKAALMSIFALTAKIIATTDPNTALGGCAPPTGMLPTIINSYVPPTTKPVFTSPKIAPIIGQAMIGR